MHAIVSQLIEHTINQDYPSHCLYIVATPIGNMADLTFRAIQVLNIVDIIICEDSRVAKKLLHPLGIQKPLRILHQHNENYVLEDVICLLKEGKKIALVSDAGTPTISDPGARLVNEIHQANLQVMPIPGANAAITALCASGLIENQFYFVGFLPARTMQRNNALKKLQDIQAIVVLYEAPHRIQATILAMSQLFIKDRKIVLARELTKKFEQIWTGNLHQANDWLMSNSQHQKGEFVILIAPGQSPVLDDEKAKHILKILLLSCSTSQAVEISAQLTSYSKKQLYQLALNFLKKEVDSTQC